MEFNQLFESQEGDVCSTLLIGILKYFCSALDDLRVLLVEESHIWQAPIWNYNFHSQIDFG